VILSCDAAGYLKGLGGVRIKLFYGWVIALSAFLILLVLGGTYSFGVFFQSLLAEFGWTRAMISGGFTLQLLVIGGFSVVTGRLTDKYGPRMVMTVGSVFLGAGYLLMSQTTSIWQLYLFYGVMIGIGNSCGWMPMLSVVTRWFVKKRGIVIGIVASGIGLGTVIVSPVAGWLISIYGWRFSYVVIGSAALVVTMVAAQFLRRDPGEMGLVPYGADKTSDSLNSADEGFSFQEVLRSWQFWIFCLAVFGYGFSSGVVMVHIVLYATGMGISVASASIILACISGVSIVGRPIMGSAGDRLGNKLVFMTSFGVMLASLLWLLIARELWMFYLFAALFGFAYGGIVALEPLLVADLFGLKSHGMVLGAVAFSDTIGGAIGSVLAGYIFDVTGSYDIATITCVIFIFIAIVALVFSKPAVTELP